MRLSPRFLVPLGVAAAIAVAAPAVSGATDGPPERVILRSELIGSTPAPDGPTLFGVGPGTSPWVSRPGRVRVTSAGGVDIRVRRLVIPIAPANGTNPVPQISASVVCDGAVAATTAPVPFDTAGNASIETSVALPSPCLAPAVLLHPNTVTTVYIAANG